MSGRRAGAATVAVLDLLAPRANLLDLALYAGAVHRAHGGEAEPLHAPAIALVEQRCDEELRAAIAEWVRSQAPWIEAAAAALEEMAALAGPPPRVPARAAAVANLAELLAVAAGDGLPEIVWAGTCAAAQWQTRYLGEEPDAVEVCNDDPLAAAAWAYLDSGEASRIATGVRAALADLDVLAEAVRGGGIAQRRGDGD